MTNLIYLDYNATAPMLPAVKSIMMNAFECYANPSSVHKMGRLARGELDKARKTIALTLETDAKNITFTGGGTEANHIVLLGLKFDPKFIYASATEHSSIYKNIAAQNLVPVQLNGQLNLEALQAMFQRDNAPKLLSVALANSETGVVQRLDEVIKICRTHGCLLHIDAVQAFGKIPVSFDALGVDLMTVSAHKLGGPKGVGAVVSKPNVMLKPILLGGGQERGLRSGTENIAGIVGFAEAAKQAVNFDWSQAKQSLKRVSDAVQMFNSEVRINSDLDGLPNTLNISTPGHFKDTQVIHFDLNNIAVSAGSACSSGKVTSSHVLTAMGINEKYVHSAIRLSIAPYTQQTELDAFICAWKQMQDIRKVEGL